MVNQCLEFEAGAVKGLRASCSRLVHMGPGDTDCDRQLSEHIRWGAIEIHPVSILALFINISVTFVSVPLAEGMWGGVGWGGG